MPRNLLSKYLARPEEPYVRPNLELVLIRTESIDSNATAPNNPGPGRNLGRLLDAVGMRLEYFLNRMAGRLRLGPDETVQKILDLQFRRRLRAWEDKEVIIFGDSAPHSEEEFRTLKKLCRKLLKYCGSRELTTQLKALNAVIALAIDSPFVREVLAGARLDLYLSTEYDETELRLLSTKAMISIMDNEVHELWSDYSRWKIRKHDVVQPNDAYLIWLKNRIKMYLSDPNVSFLVGRLLYASFTSSFGPVYQDGWGWYIEAAISNPQVIEWDTFDAFLTFKKQRVELFVLTSYHQIIQ